MRVLFAFVTLVFAATVGSTELEERGAIHQEVTQLFAAWDFQKLEALAIEYR